MHFIANDLVEMLLAHRANDGREHEFSLNPAMAKRISELKTTEGVIIWERDPDRLLGFSVRVDPDLPDGEIRLECLTFPQDLTVYQEEE